jgi:hypothetical protein
MNNGGTRMVQNVYIIKPQIKNTTAIYMHVTYILVL